MAGATQAEDTLLSYPPAIQAAQKVALELTKDWEAKRAEVNKHIARFGSIVANNPALKNAEQRTTELKALMAADLEYQSDEEQASDLRSKCELARIDLEYLQNMFRAHLAIIGGK